ncbi:MAG: hypothetical protein ACM3N4_11405 [Nitrososphaerota archaeon]
MTTWLRDFVAHADNPLGSIRKGGTRGHTLDLDLDLDLNLDSGLNPQTLCQCSAERSALVDCLAADCPNRQGNSPSCVLLSPRNRERISMAAWQHGEVEIGGNH